MYIYIIYILRNGKILLLDCEALLSPNTMKAPYPFWMTATLQKLQMFLLRFMTGPTYIHSS